MRSFVLALLFVGALCDNTPQQIHIAVGFNDTEVLVSWVTTSDTKTSIVQYGTVSTSLGLSAEGPPGDHYVWPDPPPLYRSGQLHTVKITNLQLGTKYFYKCGDKSSGTFSSVYAFSTPTPGAMLNIAVIGDIGTTNNSIANIDTMAARHAVLPYNFLLHPGDLSYANDNQTIWDIYGNMIQPLTTQVPYMVAPGNHELISLFVPYQARFTMPGEESNSPAKNLYYSFDYQIVHVIALNSEAQLYDHTLEQYKWLAADLAKVDRQKTPWVVVYFHSPWYSSNTVHQDSGNTMRESYEALFNSAKVDIVIAGHVHAYERTFSVNNGKVDPAAPEYRTCGNGGNKEGLYNTWITPKPAWSAYRNAFYGFSSMKIYNATHMYWEAFRVSNNTVADSSWTIRNR